MKNVEDIYPLAPLQRGLLFHTVTDGDGMYTQQLACRLEGDFDALAFRTAWDQVCSRHPALRTSFLWENLPDPVQIVHHVVELPWTELDWRDLTEHEAAERLDAFLAADHAQGFDPTRAPLLRITVIRLADDAYELIFSNHHLVFDGWSRAIVFRELLSLYGGVRRGGGVVLPVVRPYRDFVAWLGGLDGGLAEGVWREALAGVVAPTVLPWDPPVVARAGVDSVVVEVPEVVVDGVRGLCRGLGVTLGTVVQAGWGLLLARHAGQSDVVFGATVSGRPAQLAGVESMVGMFINTLPVRVRVDEGAPVGEWLRGLQGLLVELREFEHTPLTQIQGWSEVPRGTGLFQSLVVVENLPLGQMGSGGGPDAVVVRQVRVADETDTPLTLVAAPGEGLELRLLFQQMHYDHAGARRLLDELVCVLAGFAAGQSRPLGRVGLIERAGELERVAALNPDRAGFEQAVAPVTLFTRQVCSRPDAVALVWGERQYSYQVLHARARSIAGRLPAGSVGPERLCAVLLERSPEQVAAVLAVQLAGGAYLPIDTAYPAERIGYLLTDSGCPVLITTRALAREIPEHALAAVSLVLLDEPTTEQEGAAGQDPITAQQGADGGVAQVVPLARQLAYVIYTSGSTGHPKGVMIEHQQAARLFAAAQREFGFDDRDVWTLFHSLAFDFSVWELWGALIHGARLVLVDEPTRRSPTDLRALVAEQAVTVLNQTPSAFAPLAETILADGPDAHALRAIVFGGEALPTDRLAPWAEHIGTTRPALINMYGITETTVHVTHHALTPRDLTPDSPSVIGRPLADLHTYLLDARGHQVPTGVTGEIHVTGPGLARGYLHRPALTAQRFLPDPYATTPGARTYRTGDLARAAHDGTLYYQGRTDHQIKLRGYRIELGEIEQTLRTHPDVEHAHVQLREDTPGDKRLVAYLTPTHPETDPDTLITTLRTHAHTHLPPYMAPTAYLVLDHLPLTPHGKTDTKALPAPTHDRTGIDTTYQPPQTDTETRLAHLWTTTLHTTPIGRHDNFFTLGGDSILATVLQSRIRSVLDVELPLRVVFGSPDLAALATAIDDHASSTGAQQASAPSLAPVARGSFSPLSFGQQRFWFLEQWQPNTPLYHISGALRLTGELNAAVLQRSVDSLVARHEMLRTRLVDVAGERSQCVLASDRVPVPVVDLTGLPAAQRPTAALRLVQSAAETPFPLDGGPLWRLVLVRVAPAEHHLAVCLHHLVADGQSLTLLLDELGENYGILRARREVRRPSLPVQYGDYAVWQRDHLQGERLERELGYWRRTLAGLADVTLPTERPRPDEQTYDSATYELDLPAQVASGLPDLGRRANATPFMALFAAGAVALGQACELDDVVMGTPVANRTRPELEGLIGYLANTVVLRLRSGGCTTFEQLLDLARTVCLEAYDHAEVPFERVVHDLRPERTASHLPLFQAWFVVQDELQVATAFDGLAVEPASAIPRLARYDLRLEFRRGAEGLRLVCEYKTALFTAARIERLGRYLATALMQAVANPGLPLDELARRIRAAEDERQDRAAEAAAVYSAGALKRRRRTAHGTTETG